jgi:hypothetical protein
LVPKQAEGSDLPALLVKPAGGIEALGVEVALTGSTAAFTNECTATRLMHDSKECVSH